MDTLPQLCIDQIVRYLSTTYHGQKEQEHKICFYAAKCALVGNDIFNNMAQMLWEIIEPKCTKKTIKKFELEMKEWERFEEFIPKKKLRKAFNKKITRVAYKPKPRLSRCFISQQKRQEILKHKNEKITILKAKKDYLISNKYLSQLKQFDEDQYLLVDIEDLILKKYKSKEEFELKKELNQQNKNMRKLEIENLFGMDNIVLLLDISIKSKQYYNNYINNGGNKKELQACMNKYLQ